MSTLSEHSVPSLVTDSSGDSDAIIDTPLYYSTGSPPILYTVVLYRQRDSMPAAGTMIRFSGPVAAPHVHIATDDGDHGQAGMIVASPQPVPASPVHAAANGGMFLARCAVHLSHQDRWMSVGFAVTLASAPSLQVVKERLLNKVKKEMEAMICIYPSLQVTPKPFGRSDFENLPVDVLKRDFQIQLNEVVLANFAAGTRQGIFPRVLLKSEDYKQTLNMMVLRGYTDFLECSAKVVYVDIE